MIEAKDRAQLTRRGTQSLTMMQRAGQEACPVTGKSARRVAADLRRPDWMAKVRRRVVMGNWPAGRYDGDLRQ